MQRVLLLAVGRHNDTNVAADVWYHFLHSLLVYSGAIARSAVSDMKILVQMMKSILGQCPFKIFLCFSANDIIAREAGNNVDPHDFYRILGKTMILPLPSYTLASVADDIIIALAGISV